MVERILTCQHRKSRLDGYFSKDVALEAESRNSPSFIELLYIPVLSSIVRHCSYADNTFACNPDYIRNTTQSGTRCYKKNGCFGERPNFVAVIGHAPEE